MNTLVEDFFEKYDIDKNAPFVAPTRNKVGLTAARLQDQAKTLYDVANTSECLATYRAALMLEEMSEVLKAIAGGNLTELAHELADLKYTIVGTEVTYGIPGDKTFKAVHNANMTKKMSLFGPYKSNTYTKPDIEGALKRG